MALQNEALKVDQSVSFFFFFLSLTFENFFLSLLLLSLAHAMSMPAGEEE
jgi:hypothetical protein